MTGLTPVGRYGRELRAGLDRLFENALDWEHLPHAHASDFAAIEVVEAGPAGWRARAVLADGGPIMLDLALDRAAARWVTRTWRGERQVSEIRTQATGLGLSRCRVDVDFFADVTPERVGAAEAYYGALYDRLYDEDEAMMIARADALARGSSASAARREVALADGSRHFVPLYCPHQALPLTAEPAADGTITCPWHGYRFDVRTGACVSGRSVGWRN